MSRRRASGSAGFTLLEVLVAFLVLSIFMGVVLRGLVGARVAGSGATGVAAAEAIARSLMFGPIPASLATPGRLTGRLDGRAYVITTEAIDLPPPAPRASEAEVPDGAAAPDPAEPDPAAGEAADREPPRFVPMRLTVSVAAGENRSVTVETVRLVRLETPQ